MKTFQNFLTERKVVEESMIKDYLQSRGMHDDYKAFRKNHPSRQIPVPREEPKGWNMGTEDAVAEVAKILKQAIQNVEKVNRFGIDEVNVEMNGKRETPSGKQLSLTLSGVAAAKDKDHIIIHLKNLINAAKNELAAKGIKLAEVLYNQLQMLDEVDETSMDNPPIGLVHKHHFSVPMVVIVAGVQEATQQPQEPQASADELTF